MKTTIITAILIVLSLVLTSCFLFRDKPVKLKVYNIKGEIKLINECSGVGADNPKTVRVSFTLVYTDGTIVSKNRDIPLVLQADGVTSIGTYDVSDVPTNLKGSTWSVVIPRLCADITCVDASKSCIDMSTSAVVMPIKIKGVTTKYDKRFVCSCI